MIIMDKLKIFLTGALVFSILQVHAQYTGGAYDGFDAGYSSVMNEFRVEGPLNGEVFCQGVEVEFSWSVAVADSISLLLIGTADSLVIRESVLAEADTIFFTLPDTLSDGVYSIVMQSKDEQGYIAQTREFTVRTPSADLVGFEQSYYLDSDPVPLKGVPGGGDFWGAGVSGDQFTPEVAGLGLHEIYYLYTDGQCAADTVVKTIEVFEAAGNAPLQPYTGGPYDGYASATTGLLNQFSLDSAISATCPGNQLDIYWTADAFDQLDILYSDNGGQTFRVLAEAMDATGGQFNWDIPQNIPESQKYEIRLQSTADTTVFIRSNPFSIFTPVASFGGIAERYYMNTEAVLLTGKPDGGIFSGPGVVENYFDPAEAGIGNHTLTYEYSQNGCTAPVVEKVVEVVADDPVARSAAYTGGPYDGFAVGAYKQESILPIELTADAVFSLYENASPGKIIGELSSIILNYNDAYGFTILNDDSQILELTQSGTLKVNDPAWFDFELNQNLNFDLLISNGISDTLVSLEITLKNLNERPSIVSSIDEVDVPEGVMDTLLTSFEVFDIDGDQLITSIIGGNEDDNFYIKEHSLFTQDLDFENNNLYDLSIMVNDPGGLSDTIFLKVNVIDVNESPSITSQIYEVSENSQVGTFVGQLDASDPEGTDLIYTILSGDDTKKFSVNSQGELRVEKALLDYEDAPVYVLEVQVSDGTLVNTTQITIQLTNVNERPVFNEESYSFTVAENAVAGTEIDTVSAVDEDGDAISYTFVSGNGKGLFAIDDSGMITLAKAELDAETTINYSLGISISDGILSITGVADITVTNINEAPILTAVDLSVDENAEPETEVGSLTATDPEGDELTFAIVSGNTEDAITLDANTGLLTVNNPSVLDYETRTQLSLLVEASDGTQVNQATFTIFIQDILESRPPVAVVPNFQVYIPEADSIVLEGYDPDGDEIDYEIVTDPSMGSLAGSDNKYKFTPGNTLLPGEIYSDELTFRVVESGLGQLASENATFRFKFGVEDQGHTITSLNFNDPAADTRAFTINWDDPQFNAEYTVELAYYDLTDADNPVFKVLTTSTIALDSLSQNGQELSFGLNVNASDHPYLFEGAQVFITAEVTTSTGYSDFTSFVIDNGADNARVEASEDGLFFAFGSELTVRENRTVMLRFLAVELGDFDLSEATIELVSEPELGTLSAPVLSEIAENTTTWNATYTSTGQVAGRDSIQFRIIHPDRDVIDTAYAKVAIVGVNDEPKIEKLTDQTFMEDESLNVPLSFDDPDSEVQVIVESGDTKGFPVNYADGMISLTPAANFNGFASVSVIVQEVGTDEEFTAFTRFDVKVLAVNDTPVLTAITDHKIDEDQNLTLSLSAVDVDNSNQVFVYRATADNPSEVKFNITGNTLEIIPETNVFGAYTIAVTADDQEGTETSVSAEETFTFEVEAVNDVPEVVKVLKTQNLLSNLPEYSIKLSAFFRDVEDGSALSYSSSGNENVLMTFDGDEVKVSTASGFIGVEDVMITATDSEGAFTQQSITFVVTAESADVSVANAIPKVILSEDFGSSSIDLMDVFALSGDASATFTHQIVGNNFVDAEVDSGGKLTLSSTPDFFGSEIFYLIGTSDGKSGYTSFEVEIFPVNDAPQLTFLEAQSGPEDQNLSNVFIAVSDVDNTLSEIGLSGISADQSVVADEKITFSVTSGGYLMDIEPQPNQNGMVIIEVVASDGTASDTIDFELTVSPVNDAPVVANPLADVDVKQESSWTYSVPTNTFTDVDANDVITTTITQYPAWATLSDGALTGTPQYEDLGEYTLQVMATDRSGSTVTAEAMVTVTFTVYDAEVVLDATETCEGKDAVISASGAVDYNWYDSDGNLLQSGGDEYMVTAKDALVIEAEGLDAVGRVTLNKTSITLSAFALPEVALSLDGSTLSVAETAGGSYRWYRDGTRIEGATGSSYLAAESGEYVVKVTTGNGCTATSEAVLLEVLGLRDELGGINLYPNPVVDWITLGSDAPIHEMDVVIYDALGKAYELPIDRSAMNALRIDFSEVSTGVFFIKLKVNEETIINRIVKVK